MKEEGIESLKDWRGTPINIGDTAIYGAGVGRSIELVEGTVAGFTASGRVQLRLVRTSFTTRTKRIVDVGADRMTIVRELAKSAVPTVVERQRANLRVSIERTTERIRSMEAGEPQPEWVRIFGGVDGLRRDLAKMQKELSELEH